MKKITVLFLLLTSFLSGFSQEDDHTKELNIPYYSKSITEPGNYISEKCLLDVYCPVGVKNFPTIVYIHGGALTRGDKALPPGLLKKGMCVVSVNYRLYPKVKCPAYLEDAAAAVAWVFKNIEKYNGDPNLIFVSGHSAGGYLTSMVGLDKKWLAAQDIDANQIAGLFPLSGNGINQQAIRDEKGISPMTPWIDEYSPLYHVRPDAPPFILMSGDRELEYMGRYEENAYLARMMKLVGHKETVLYEFDGYGHFMTTPAFPLVIKWVNTITERIKDSQK